MGGIIRFVARDESTSGLTTAPGNGVLELSRGFEVWFADEIGPGGGRLVD